MNHNIKDDYSEEEDTDDNEDTDDEPEVDLNHNYIYNNCERFKNLMCQQSYMNNSLFLGDKYMYAKFHDPVPYGSLYILFSRHARCVVREYLP
jgi:hypothetical protein